MHYNKQLIKMSILLFLLIVGTLSDTVLSNSGDENYDKYLMKYGYLEEIPEAISSDQPRNFDIGKRRDTALLAYQMYFGLPMTGKFDDKTREMMSRPRCGVPDLKKLKTIGRGKRQVMARPYTHLGSKWKDPVVTWKVNSYTRKLDRERQRSTFYRAFKIWEDVSAIKLRETTGKADMEISFERYIHGDGVGNAFDGRSGVLAHAYGPGESSIAGDTHFDDDEDWRLNSDEGSDLYVTAAHEFGHALGLGHSNRPEALMFPIYKKADELKLAQDDIRGIQTLYGSRLNPPRPTPRRPTVTERPRVRPPVRRTERPRVRPTFRPRPTTEVPVTTTSSAKCGITIDQVLEDKDGSYYVFQNDIVHTIQNGQLLQDGSKMIQEVFESSQGKPDLAFTTPYKDKIYIVKDSSVWRYSSTKLDEGYPKEINNKEFPEKPRFVLSFMDDFNRLRTLIFGTEKWWEYDFDDPRPSTLYYYDIDYNFYDMPKNIRFAVRKSDSDLFYLITDNRYAILNTKRRSLLKTDGNEGLPDWINNVCNIIQLNSASQNNMSVMLAVSTGLLLLVSIMF